MSRLRVLKLGWEFPPLLNGGLGVACFGLSRALARQVELTVLVPRAARGVAYPDFVVRAVESGAPPDDSPREGTGWGESYEQFARLHAIPIELDPYAAEERSFRAPRGVLAGGAGGVAGAGAEERAPGCLRSLELYGPDLGRNVVEFSKIALQIALQESFDLIHAHDWMTFLAGVEIKRATGKPLIVHVHASQYDRAGAEARGWIYEIEKCGMLAADRIIPVSHYTGQILVEHYGVDPANIRPVHNGADPVATFVTRKKFPEKLVLFLGRLTAQKGPEGFLEIASRVLEWEPEVRFVMAGTGDKLRPLIESGAFRGLGGHFHFTGFLDQEKVHELLSMTDVYCMPSVSEPFGLSALEAAQFGIPAVLSRQSGVSEVLRGALLADWWDAEGMARHIHCLLTDEALRARVVAQARQDIRAATWEAAAKVLSIYHEVSP